MRRTREDLQLTQAEFAEMIGCTTSHISHIELGEARPTPDFVKKVITYLEAGPALAKRFHRYAAEAQGWNFYDE